MRLLFPSLMLLMIVASCRPLANYKVALVTTTFYGTGGPGSVPPLEVKVHILFNGNQSIQEVPVIKTVQDSAGQRIFSETKHFSLLDTQRGLCLNYYHLSDTAKPFGKFSDIDSVKADGGWNIYSKEQFPYDSAFTLPDTVVHNKALGRLQIFRDTTKRSIYLVLYYDRHSKPLPMKLFNTISDSLGYPVLRDDTYSDGKLFMTRQLEFTGNSLSAAQQNVFTAWSKHFNEKSNRTR